MMQYQCRRAQNRQLLAFRRSFPRRAPRCCAEGRNDRDDKSTSASPGIGGDVVKRIATVICVSFLATFVVAPGLTPSTIDIFLQQEVYGSRRVSQDKPPATSKDKQPAAPAPPPPAPPVVDAYPHSRDPLYTTVVPLAKEPPREVAEPSPAEKERLEKERLEKERLEKDRQKEKADAERLLKEKEEQARKDKEKKAQEEKVRKQKELEKEEARRAEVQRKAAEARRKQYEREALIAGGSVGLGFISLAKWPVLLEVFAAFFRLIGGPTLISTALRTPGYILGKKIRLVEWDLQASPSVPDGCLVTINLRQFTSTGLRAAIAKAYNLDSPRQIKQIAHWVMIGPHFYEQTGPQQSLMSLPDKAVLVWTQVSPSVLVMPARGDRLPSQAVAGVPKDAAHNLAGRGPQTELLHAIAALAALSRGEMDCPLPLDPRRDADRRASGHEAEGGANGSHARDGAAASTAPARDASARDGVDDDYVNGGALAWLARQWQSRNADKQRADARGDAKDGFPGDYGLRKARASAGGAGNGASPQPGWQILADVKRAARTPAGTVNDRPAEMTAVVSDGAKAAPEVDVSELEAPATLDASVHAVSWQQLKRAGLANVKAPASFAVIDPALEERMIIVAASSDAGLQRLFDAFAAHDVFRFIQYARTYVDVPK